MFVYAKDLSQEDTIYVITMEECKASPWRWKFVKVSPGQVEEEIKVEPVKEPEIDSFILTAEKEPIAAESVAKPKSTKRFVSKK